MATHSSILAWKMPCTEEPDRLQSMGLHRVGHDSNFILTEEKKPNPVRKDKDPFFEHEKVRHRLTNELDLRKSWRLCSNWRQNSRYEGQ